MENIIFINIYVYTYKFMQELIRKIDTMNLKDNKGGVQEGLAEGKEKKKLENCIIITKEKEKNEDKHICKNIYIIYAHNLQFILLFKLLESLFRDQQY